MEFLILAVAKAAFWIKAIFGSISGVLFATLVVPNVGEQIALEALVNKTAPQDLRLKLYKNNITPGETDTAGTYTVADFTGYSDFNFTAASWTYSAGNPSDVHYAQQAFTSSAAQSAQSIYGYYVIQVSSGTLVWAERFPDGPYTISNNGDEIRITAKITAE